jgi:hypothetical protein
MNYETEGPTRDDAVELVDVTTRDGYNAVVIDEAIACQVDNITSQEDGDDGPDEELGAQIAICQERTGPAQDRAVDHLVQMLLVSYLDLEDLPRPVPAREESVAGELRVVLTADQRNALRLAALAIVKTSPEDDEVAAFEAILFALDASGVF